MKIWENRLMAGALSRTLLGELTALILACSISITVLTYINCGSAYRVSRYALASSHTSITCIRHVRVS